MPLIILFLFLVLANIDNISFYFTQTENQRDRKNITLVLVSTLAIIIFYFVGLYISTKLPHQYHHLIGLCFFLILGLYPIFHFSNKNITLNKHDTTFVLNLCVNNIGTALLAGFLNISLTPIVILNVLLSCFFIYLSFIIKKFNSSLNIIQLNQIISSTILIFLCFLSLVKM